MKQHFANQNGPVFKYMVASLPEQSPSGKGPNKLLNLTMKKGELEDIAKEGLTYLTTVSLPIFVLEDNLEEFKGYLDNSTDFPS